MALKIFERMVETAELIARHPDYPGKQEVVRQCLEEVQDLRDSGRISLCQCERLQFILEGMVVTN
ncbi:hypothetical protein BH23PLA1_BH23PLA1_19870 [soil metagenome]